MQIRTMSKNGTLSTMRTSINLDPEVHEFTSAYANAKGITLSAAINELIRRAEKAPEPQNAPGRLKRNEHGYLVIAGTGNVVTPEMVKELSEDKLV
jgi:macrodomain Ter protein organizer (MatP/YcbG family)